MVVMHRDAHIDDVVDFFLQHFCRQAERGDVVAHQPASHGLRFEYRALITQRHQVIGHRQGGATGTDQRNLFPVLLSWNKRQALADIFLVIRGDTFQPANRHRFFVHSAAATGRLAGAVTYTAQDTRKDVAFAVEHVGIGKSPLGNQANVFRHIGMRRTTPLAVNDLVKIIRI
jgi:hypothetical protein